MKDDMLAEIDDLLLEVSSSNIEHKVWNSLFAGWEDLDEYNVTTHHRSDDAYCSLLHSLEARNNVGGWQYIMGHNCQCPKIYAMCLFEVVHPTVKECFPAKESVNVLSHPLFESNYSNFIAVLWYELYIGPCEVRRDYIHQPERVLADGVYRNQIWYSSVVAQAFTPEEQDRIIKLLMTFESER